MLCIQQLFPEAHLLSAWRGQLLSNHFPWNRFMSRHLVENILEFQAVSLEFFFFLLLFFQVHQVPCSGKCPVRFWEGRGWLCGSRWELEVNPHFVLKSRKPSVEWCAAR